ncbi:MAG: 30S ribosomal protein S5 [Chlamydiales bacterium]|nr:30S ribosomal protein S5 [Chlamydiales bacterium]MCH9635784.1 30S ribosomal protein S5 [Chlamydiales bacterium]MCH9703953.1 30S ribosomal protein S5 [Chlamydiota bacterium]
MANRNAPQKNDDGLEEKVLFVNRCSKVVKGGRKFSFSALILVGDRKGKVGFGFAKANELTDAIRKGGESARKNMISFEVDGDTIPHEVFVDYDGAQLLMKPAPDGKGVVAGSRVRSILEYAGLRNVVAKSMGSNNPINQVKATFKALSSLRNKKQMMELRGMS